MRESTYTASVGRLLPPSVYALKLSLPYTAGVPDSWYSGRGGDLWIEWKYLRHIPREVDLIGNKDPVITRLQQKWLQDRYDEGRQIGVIVGTPAGAVVLPDLDWQSLFLKADFESRLWTKRQVADWITHRVSGSEVVGKSSTIGPCPT